VTGRADLRFLRRLSRVQGRSQERRTVEVIVTGGLPIPDEERDAPLAERYPITTTVAGKRTDWIIRGRLPDLPRAVPGEVAKVEAGVKNEAGVKGEVDSA
jgi:hypothetical protein